MNKKTLDKIKKVLFLERDNIIAQQQLQSCDIDNDGDEVDEIQANLIASVNSKLSSRYIEKLKKIDLALHKIDNKKFGNCEDCNEEISEKRLLINPYFSTCVDCAEDREKGNK